MHAGADPSLSIGRNSPESRLLENLEPRIRAAARHALRTYSCRYDRAGVDEDELVQLGSIAAWRRLNGTVRSIAASELKKEMLFAAIQEMHDTLKEFFRHCDVQRRHADRVADWVSDASAAASPGLTDDTVAARQYLRQMVNDPVHGDLVRAVIANGGEATKTSLSESLSLDRETVSRRQMTMKMRFYK